MVPRVLAPGRWPLMAALALVAVGIQLWGLYRVTGPPSPAWFSDADKAEHLVGFAAPVLLVLLSVELATRHRHSRSARRAVVVGVVLVFAAHGVLSEVVQQLAYRTRTGDPRDTAADWVGVLLGWAGFAILARRSGRPAARSRPAEPGGRRARA